MRSIESKKVRYLLGIAIVRYLMCSEGLILFFSICIAIEAGRMLTGKVVIELKEKLELSDLTLEVNGKEKTFKQDEVDGKTIM